MRVRHWIVPTVTVLLAVASPVTTAPWAQTDKPEVAQPSAAEQLPAEIPDAARNRQNPRPATPESIAAGGRTYASQCTMCHGSSGGGTGDLVGRLKLQMPDLTDRAQQKKRTDGELFYILTYGHGRMHGEGDRLSDDTKWDIVNYLRTLASEG